MTSRLIRRALHAGAGLALTLSAAAPFAHAQAPVDQQPTTSAKGGLTENVKELMRAGFAEYKKGRYEAARVAFARAWALQRHGEVAGALAEVEMRLGRFAEAAEHWNFYLGNELPDRDEAAAQLAECKKHVSLVSLTVKGEAEVLLDGASVEMREVYDHRRVRELWLSPGTYVFQVRTAGPPPVERRVELHVAIGKDHELDLTPEPPPSAPAPVRPVAPPVASGLPVTEVTGRSGTSNARLIVTVTGAALTVGAVTFGVVSRLRSNAAWDHRGQILADLQRDAPPGTAPDGLCSPDREDYPTTECALIRSEIDRTDSLRNTANGAFIAGGVLGVATIATFLLWPKDSRASEHHRILVTPLPIAGSQGLQLETTF